eukprot:TRINITY_DN15245_c0_g7_i1.p1 TRINITY_DN15245_c0_g7~~TRINITY_DN15245_c0_g7_i1.p1  ORF type:complete len:120 (+),score=26.49 TRINITY_DN15245_c0_g7_i1:81-440(+)
MPSQRRPRSRASRDAQQQVVEVFRLFDQNGDGGIDRDEMANVLQLLDPVVWTDQRIEQMFEAADCNMDGRLQCEEFLAWAFGGDDASESLQTAVNDLHTPKTCWGKAFRRTLEKETKAS